MMIKKICWAVLILIVSFSGLLLIGANYYANVYGSDYLNEILFYMATGLENADLSVMTDFFKSQWMILVVAILLLIFPLFTFNQQYLAEIKFKNQEKTIRLFPFFKSLIGKTTYTFIVLLSTLVFTYYTIELDAYLAQINSESSFIEDHYVDPEETKITFPEKKRNLIVLYLESMEPTMMSKKNGGAWDKSVMPELEALAMQHVNFSNTELLGGMLPAMGTTWTVAGLVSTTAGIPLRIPVGGGNYNSDNLLSGATTLGDILHAEGYHSGFIFGSDARYGGRYQYFTKHGDYQIFDVETAIERRYMTEEDKVFWGFEDGHLFEWAKEEILALAEQPAPFHYGLLTVNTHFPDGWLEENAPTTFETQYENVHALSSQQVSDFIHWLQQQSFYEDTTIVLVGDHKSMQPEEFYEDRISEDYTRVVFNTFINSAISPQQEKMRDFTSFDIFPSLLASIGVEIEGDYLGLGANLFSNVPTLAEMYGIFDLNEELGKRSAFYNTKFLADDYLELQKRKRELEAE